VSGWARAAGGPELRIFWSDSQGWFHVDDEDESSVWETDISGYRVTDLPSDAVELVPAEPAAHECIVPDHVKAKWERQAWHCSCGNSYVWAWSQPPLDES